MKLKQYKNLILLTAAVIFLVVIIAADPLGFCVQRAHDRAAVRNQMTIEKAETDQRVAIITARTEAVLRRIAEGETAADALAEPETDTLAGALR